MRVNAAGRLSFEIVAVLLLGLYFCFNALPKAWRSLNTDFPNYYVTARLVREGIDVSRAYEWVWIEREKDHLEVDQRVIGLVPITPFSTLLLIPISRLAPLTAKHVWTIFNLLLLTGIAPLLARVSGLSVLRATLLLGLSYPMQRNLLYGQYYILLLAILVAGLWAAQKSKSTFAGTLVGLAAALKIFPIVIAFYFFRKRDWRALLACVTTVAASVFLSIRVLGLGIHRTYLDEVLPWTLHGDCLPPFNLASSSISTVLHRLFVYEPQWNPHPAVHAAWLLPVLHPVLQALLLAPALLWIGKNTAGSERTALEWSGLLLAALTISPLPASYHFTVLLLPVCVVVGNLTRNRKHGLLWLTIAAFLAIGLPSWHIHAREGWSTLLCVPRLYVMVGLLLLTCSLLAKGETGRRSGDQIFWIAGITALTLLSIFSGVRHQRGLLDDYRYRVPMESNVLLAAHPVALASGDAAFIALTPEGYHGNTLANASLQGSLSRNIDQLSLAASRDQLWTEDVTKTSSVHGPAMSSIKIENAESPSLSANEKIIAYLRQTEGLKQLFMQDLSHGDRTERQVTFPPMNVYEETFLPNGSLVFAASANETKPTLFLLTPAGKVTSFYSTEARYPAASPDGHWLAFSGFVDGSWNLFLQDIASGVMTRLTEAPCNQIEPAWEKDSKTILYATDCGRALWFTALARRRVIP